MTVEEELFTIRDLLRFAVTRMETAGVGYGHGTDTAIDEAVFLIAALLRLPHDGIEPFLDARLTLAERREAIALIERRIATRKPAAYLVNRAYIGGVAFYVDERVIVPRSFIGELILGGRLAEAGLIPDDGAITRILDLCTGSGCLAILAALAFPDAAVDAVDLSPDALAVARRNVDDHGLSRRISLYQGDLFEPLPARTIRSRPRQSALCRERHHGGAAAGISPRAGAGAGRGLATGSMWCAACWPGRRAASLRFRRPPVRDRRRARSPGAGLSPPAVLLARHRNERGRGLLAAGSSAGGGRMMFDLTCFAPDYAAARTKFIAAAAAAGATLRSYRNPHSGPAGEELWTDAAWLGPAPARKVLVTISATHGVEGFCGSGAQVDFFACQPTLPEDVAVLAIHALNPHGFAWLRRATEEGVDLNRNHVDFAKPLPRNPGYAELADAIVPAAWTDEALAAARERMEAYGRAHGLDALRIAESGGQYTHPDGLFFGGHRPTWSRLTMERIIADHRITARALVCLLDYHTGLGPYGYGEAMTADPPGSPPERRAADWFGKSVTNSMAGTTSSTPSSVSSRMAGRPCSASGPCA